MEWGTKKRSIVRIRDMYKLKPKGYDPHRFLLSRELAIPFKKYKGIELEYCKLLPKGHILLVDLATYKQITDELLKRN